MKRVLITGAAGFIGSSLCEKIIDKYELIGIDNLISGNLNNLKKLFNYENFDFIKADITNPISLNKKIDYIFHLASPASPVAYTNHPIETLKTNSIGTENILELAKKYNSRVLIASTSEIYGDPNIHPQREDYFGNVNPVGPRSMYDESKRYSEAISTAYSLKYGLDVKIARIFNTYGPRMKVNDGRVIPNFVNQLINNNDFTVYGDGMQTRSFCYIDDTISALIKLIKSDYNKPVNIGNPNEITILELLEKIKKLKKNNIKTQFKKIPQDDPKKRRPNIDLAKKILNWEPLVDIDEGLTKTYKHYLK